VAGLASSLFVVIPIYVLGLWGFWKDGSAVGAVSPFPSVSISLSRAFKHPFHCLILSCAPVFIVLGKEHRLACKAGSQSVFANIVLQH
jgi:hypothetical protein